MSKMIWCLDSYGTLFRVGVVSHRSDAYIEELKLKGFTNFYILDEADYLMVLQVESLVSIRGTEHEDYSNNKVLLQNFLRDFSLALAPNDWESLIIEMNGHRYGYESQIGWQLVKIFKV